MQATGVKAVISDQMSFNRSAFIYSFPQWTMLVAKCAVHFADA